MHAKKYQNSEILVDFGSEIDWKKLEEFSKTCPDAVITHSSVTLNTAISQASSRLNAFNKNDKSEYSGITIGEMRKVLFDFGLEGGSVEAKERRRNVRNFNSGECIEVPLSYDMDHYSSVNIIRVVSRSNGDVGSVAKKIQDIYPEAGFSRLSQKAVAERL